ncbi:MAG: LptF/LptG family permease [Alphaproteobacteria bacterium]|nr:LptF/LptG family permease [Alphaproteobacteria bacterium]
MFKITSYILRQLSWTTFFIALVLSGAIWLTQSLRFIDIVLNQGLPFSTFLNLIFYLLPDLISIVLPSALLGSVIFTYNRLTVDQELIVLRSVGVSDWQLTKPTLIVAATVTMILYAISLYLLPIAFQNFRNLEHHIRNTASLSLLREGEFNTIQGLTVFIHSSEGPKNFKGIIIENTRDPQKPFLIIAENGSIIESEQGARLILTRGIRQENSPKTAQPSMLYFDQYTLDLSAGFPINPNRSRKPHEYFLKDLFQPNKTQLSLTQRKKFRAQGHQRILGPLHALAFALIGVCTFLFGDFNRRGRAKRILLVIGLCCLLQVATIALVHFSERASHAIDLAYMILILAILSPLALCLQGLEGFKRLSLLIDYFTTKKN